jgi:hypothetical protein
MIRMRALGIQELPSHPDLASQQKDAPDVQTFVTSALEEAETFMTKYVPHRFNVKNSGKRSPPSTAEVALSSHELQAKDLPKEARDAGAGNETWFARTSIHENAAKQGTASWEEFDNGLRVDHSQHEMDYTPDVYDAHEVMNWNSVLESSQNSIGGWTDVHVSVMEMAHKIAGPINNRVFPVLVITAKKAQEFIVVQIPVATKSLPNAKYHNVPKVTGGMYCSVERGELVEGGAKVQWQMATASDAKGSLPMWAQKLGVPGAVVKDVGLFIGWCEKKRKA